MSSTTLSSLTTYDDYRTLPDDGKLHQIIEGKLYMTPVPTPEHQDILLNLATSIRDFAKKHRLGKVYTAPIDVILSMTDVIQPDIIFVAKDRLRIVTEKNIVDAPDLIIEIISPSTESIDRNKKFSLYEKHGVKEYWLADPARKEIQQYLLKESSYHLTSTSAAAQKLSSEVLAGFSITPSEVFE